MIALVDTRTARLDEGVIGVVISTHERMAFALAANLEFQRSLGTRGHVTTKILTLSRRLHEGETVRSEDVWQNPWKLTAATWPSSAARDDHTSFSSRKSSLQGDR